MSDQNMWTHTMQSLFITFESGQHTDEQLLAATHLPAGYLATYEKHIKISHSKHWNMNSCTGREVSEKRFPVLRADDQRYLQQKRPAST